MTYITSEVLSSKHKCVVGKYCSNLDKPKRLANSKLYTISCLSPLYKEFPFFVVFCTNKSHRRIWDARCHCSLCFKMGPASLKSICINKLGYLINSERKLVNM